MKVTVRSGVISGPSSCSARASTESAGSPAVKAGAVLMNCPGAGQYSSTRVIYGLFCAVAKIAVIAKIEFNNSFILITINYIKQ